MASRSLPTSAGISEPRGSNADVFERIRNRYGLTADTTERAIFRRTYASLLGGSMLQFVDHDYREFERTGILPYYVYRFGDADTVGWQLHDLA